jgi:hypothetical protein
MRYFRCLLTIRCLIQNMTLHVNVDYLYKCSDFSFHGNKTNSFLFKFDGFVKSRISPFSGFPPAREWQYDNLYQIDTTDVMPAKPVPAEAGSGYPVLKSAQFRKGVNGA